MSAAADNVIDLRDWRAHRRPEAVPPDALAEIAAARRVYDALLARGHELRFDLSAEDGHVRAELRSLDGAVVRAVSLTEALGIEGRLPAA